MSKKKLKVASGISLPIETVTESIAILGRRGSGKSNTAVVFAEEMFRAGVPWVAIDPKGDWFGIRSDISGKGPGLPIPVFGGLHGDVPLEEGAGELVANLLVDENLTAVLDTSDFSKAARRRFLTGFFETLYQRHRRDPHPRHVFMEEAHEIIPQQVPKGETQLKEVASRIVLEGRSFGLGSSVCSQRSARIHKDVLTQTSILIAMWTTGPHDRKAIADWVTEHDAHDDIIKSLATLEPGEAWVWATPIKLMERTKIRQRETFDSGATPEFGKQRTVATIADVDTKAIESQMAGLIERAKENDPKELRAEVKKLRRQVEQAKQAEPEIVVETETIEVIPEQVKIGVDHVLHWGDKIVEVISTLSGDTSQMENHLRQLRSVIDMVDETPKGTVERSIKAASKAKPQVKRRVSGDASADTNLSKAERLALTALAQYHPKPRGAKQVAILTGYSHKGGGFRNALSSLRTSGYIEGMGDMFITEAGFEALGGYDALPTGRELAEHWYGKLGKAERLALKYLVGIWPEGADADGVAAGCGETDDPDATAYAANGGGFRNALSKLRTLELIEGYGEMRASDDLFD